MKQPLPRFLLTLFWLLLAVPLHAQYNIWVDQITDGNGKAYVSNYDYPSSGAKIEMKNLYEIQVGIVKPPFTWPNFHATPAEFVEFYDEQGNVFAPSSVRAWGGNLIVRFEPELTVPGTYSLNIKAGVGMVDDLKTQEVTFTDIIVISGENTDPINPEPSIDPEKWYSNFVATLDGSDVKITFPNIGEGLILQDCDENTLYEHIQLLDGLSVETPYNANVVDGNKSIIANFTGNGVSIESETLVIRIDAGVVSVDGVPNPELTYLLRSEVKEEPKANFNIWVDQILDGYEKAYISNYQYPNSGAKIEMKSLYEIQVGIVKPLFTFPNYVGGDLRDYVEIIDSNGNIYDPTSVRAVGPCVYIRFDSNLSTPGTYSLRIKEGIGEVDGEKTQEKTFTDLIVISENYKAPVKWYTDFYADVKDGTFKICFPNIGDETLRANVEEDKLESYISLTFGDRTIDPFMAFINANEDKKSIVGYYSTEGIESEECVVIISQNVLSVKDIVNPELIWPENSSRPSMDIPVSWYVNSVVDKANNKIEYSDNTFNSLENVVRIELRGSKPDGMSDSRWNDAWSGLYSWLISYKLKDIIISNGFENIVPASVTVDRLNNNAINLFFDEPITNYGSYSITLPEKLISFRGGTYSAAATIENAFIIKGNVQSEWESYTAVSPNPKLTTLSSIGPDFYIGPRSYKDHVEIANINMVPSLTLPDGTVVYGTFSPRYQLGMDLGEVIAQFEGMYEEKGEYKLTIPEGALKVGAFNSEESYGTNPEYTIVYKVLGEAESLKNHLENYSLTPESGSTVHSIHRNLMITFPDVDASMDFGRVYVGGVQLITPDGERVPLYDFDVPLDDDGDRSINSTILYFKEVYKSPGEYILNLDQGVFRITVPDNTSLTDYTVLYSPAISAKFIVEEDIDPEEVTLERYYTVPSSEQPVSSLSKISVVFPQSDAPDKGISIVSGTDPSQILLRHTYTYSTYFCKDMVVSESGDQVDLYFDEITANGEYKLIIGERIIELRDSYPVEYNLPMEIPFTLNYGNESVPKVTDLPWQFRCVRDTEGTNYYYYEEEKLQTLNGIDQVKLLISRPEDMEALEWIDLAFGYAVNQEMVSQIRISNGVDEFIPSSVANNGNYIGIDLNFSDAVTSNGTYSLFIPEGLITFGNGTISPETRLEGCFTISYNGIEFDLPWEFSRVRDVDGQSYYADEEDRLHSLNNIDLVTVRISKPEGIEFVKWAELALGYAINQDMVSRIRISNGVEEFSPSSVSNNGYIGLDLNFSDAITSEGTYSLYIPEGLVTFGNGTISQETRLENCFTISYNGLDLTAEITTGNVVEALQMFSLNFLLNGETWVGMDDNVHVNPEKNVKVTGDGETYMSERVLVIFGSAINVRLDREITKPGMYTIEIPEGLVSYKGMYNQAIDVEVVVEQSLEILKGDSNGSGEVNIADAVNIANYAVGNEVENFDMEASDVNEDGRITVGDASATVAIILAQPSEVDESESDARRMAPSAHNMVRLTQTSEGEVTKVSLSLDGNTGFSALQGEILVPVGASISDVMIGEGAPSHALATAMTDNGNLRFVLFDPNVGVLEDGSPLLTILVRGADTASRLTATSLVASDSDAREHRLAPARADIATGVNALDDSEIVRANAEGLLITAPAGETVFVFTPDGKRVAQFVSDGVPRQLHTLPGIYLVSVGRHTIKTTI